MAHLRAVQPLDIPKKFISALGANVDCAHGVVQEDPDVCCVARCGQSEGGRSETPHDAGRFGVKPRIKNHLDPCVGVASR